MIDSEPCPGEASQTQSKREECGGGATCHDQRCQSHEERLAKICSTGEQLPHVGGGQLALGSDGVRQVAGDLDHQRHQDVGE